MIELQFSQFKVALIKMTSSESFGYYSKLVDPIDVDFVVLITNWCLKLDQTAITRMG